MKNLIFAFDSYFKNNYSLYNESNSNLLVQPSPIIQNIIESYNDFDLQELRNKTRRFRKKNRIYNLRGPGLPPSLISFAPNSKINSAQNFLNERANHNFKRNFAKGNFSLRSQNELKTEPKDFGLQDSNSQFGTDQALLNPRQPPNFPKNHSSSIKEEPSISQRAGLSRKNPNNSKSGQLSRGISGALTLNQSKKSNKLMRSLVKKLSRAKRISKMISPKFEENQLAECLAALAKQNECVRLLQSENRKLKSENAVLKNGLKEIGEKVGRVISQVDKIKKKLENN